MARERSPEREKAKQIWIDRGGTAKLKDIAAELGIGVTQVRKWKSQDHWDDDLKGNVTNESKGNVTNQKERGKHRKPDPEPADDEDGEIDEIDGLSPRMRLFVHYYLIEPNATQAAIKAGYSEKTAHVQGPRMLGNVRILEAINAGMSTLYKRLDITAERVLQELAKIGFSDMRSFVRWGSSGVQLKNSEDLSDEDAAAVAEVSETITKDGGSIKFKLHDKKGALELMGKNLKLFTEKVDLNALTLNRNVDISHMSDAEIEKELMKYAGDRIDNEGT